ncbi:MAG: MBL fold metallo-hydrolase [Phycisphaerales bacterium]
MLPKPPARLGQLGFLYIPPIRVQGVSVAGENTAVMIPEYDICFDIGACHRPMLAAKYVAITHGHMDHVAGLPYYFSQRWFQGMGTGVCVCDARIEPAVKQMMEGWVELEQQRTSHEIIGLGDGGELEIKNNIFLRAFEVDHTVPAIAYGLSERRTKLREEYHNLPQDALRKLKQDGVEITRELRVPLVTYIGDTLPGAHLFRDEILKTKVLIMECTFFDDDHRERAVVGKHVHLDDIAELYPHLECEALVLTHVSRRTNLGFARKRLVERLGAEATERVHLLMDHRTNRQRYEAQLAEAEAAATASDAPVDSEN